ncbi:hypothetical protein HQ571_01480 [Candidatus Kuenenbacteria bacterium]|nr:hypothetical protein [Candidatus Kuenenbacteria bacterium]
MRNTKKIVIFTLILGLIFPFQTVFAVDFNNGYIISDQDLVNSSAMTLGEIQNFLDRRNGTLDTYTAIDDDGEIITAAEIIFNASVEHVINPKFLLVMLQKEQSLVEDSSPTQKQYDWAMGYGICDSCDMDDPSLLKFKGFANQVDNTAGANRWYIDTEENWIKRPGNTYEIDGEQVNIMNQATANLYNFTPHIHGNYNFWKIWNRWFNQSYPDGSLLQGEGEQGVWLIDNGMRRPFHSKSALVSRYDLDNIIIVSKNEIDKYEIGRAIKFANYSLLQIPTEDVYLLVNDELRKFESKEVLRTLGFNPEEYEQLSLVDFEEYELGEQITMTSAYPAGGLLQDNTTGGVFFVQDGHKYAIITKDIFEINYPNYTLTSVTPEELSKFPRWGEVRLKNGIIVKSVESPIVYVISNEKKRPIVSADVYERLGYKWENIKVVSEKSLSNMPLGSAVDLDFKK